MEGQVLLPLLLEEKRLLAHYGPDHPDVRSVRERIQIVREYLAKHPPAIVAPGPPGSGQAPHREAPNTTASTIRSPGQPLPLPFPPVGGQTPGPGRTEGNTQTATSRGQPELIRAVGYSTAGNPIPGPVPASPAAPPPTVVEAKDKGSRPAVITSANPSAQAVVSAPAGAGDGSASQPSQEQPRGRSLFETGFVQLIGIVGAVLLGTLIHQIALVLILRRYGARLARVFRVELVNPAAVGVAGQVSAAGTHTVAAGPATVEVTQGGTAETFDVGPSYVEEMREKQEALRQQEEGLLRHIFEQNMQMREQLGQLSDGAA